MPLIHIVNEPLRMVMITGLGEEALPEAEDSLANLLRDPDIVEGYRFLIVVHPRAPAPEPSDIGRLAAMLSVLRDRLASRIAIVTTAVGQATPAALMAMMVDDPQVRVFMDETDARQWLLDSVDWRVPTPMGGQTNVR